MVTLQLRQIRVMPGQRVILEDIIWQEFEAILDELGEHRNSRIADNQGILEIAEENPSCENLIIQGLSKSYSHFYNQAISLAFSDN